MNAVSSSENDEISFLVKAGHRQLGTWNLGNAAGEAYSADWTASSDWYLQRSHGKSCRTSMQASGYARNSMIYKDCVALELCTEAA